MNGGTGTRSGDQSAGRTGGVLRVLLLTSGYPPIVGGAEAYAATLADGLAGLGHDVLVLTDHLDGVGGGDPAGYSAHADGNSDTPGTPGPEVRRLARYRALLADPSKLRWEQMAFGILPELEQTLEQWRPDVIVANGLETAVLGRMVAYELGVPLVGSFHEHAPEDEPFGQGKMALGYRYLDLDAVLAGSQSYQARALRFLDEGRVHLIHHGVDTHRFSPDVSGERMRARYRLDRDRILIVSAGRLKARKGQAELIESFARAAHDEAYLVVAGSVSSASPEYADRLDSLIDRLGLRDHAVVDQSVPPADMPELFAAADIVAQPSHSEGLGLALLEAMSAGRPCVASLIDGHAEIFSAGGRAPETRPEHLVEPVEPRDVSGLADALKRLQADGARRAVLGAAAREHVERHFSQQLMLARTDALLRGVAARGPGAAR